MPSPMARADFADVLDPRFRKIFAQEFKKLHRDMVPVLHGMTPPTTPWRDTERFSAISGLTRMGQFTGQVDFASASQLYDVTASYLEFAKGIQIERTLIEWDQHNVMNQLPKSLAQSAFRNRQFYAHYHLANMFSATSLFYSNGDGLALCSDTHTTTTGASTAAGFDNLNTAAFSHGNLATLQIQMADFRNDQAEPIEVVGDTILAPINLYANVWEVVNSPGRSSDDSSARNVHEGVYTVIFLRNKVDFPATSDWALVDGTQMKDQVLWLDQVYPGGQPEFKFLEDFGSYVGKWKAYMRYTKVVRDWRWIIGNQVA